jgi:hypothetical protein
MDLTDGIKPMPDQGETSYKACGRLAWKKAVITGVLTAISVA